MNEEPPATMPPDRLLRPARPLRLSEEVESLLNTFAEHPVRLREVITVLHQRAYTFLLILLALPFCTPLPLPGLSIPFGMVIALVGFRLALGQKPWLPVRLLDTELPPRFFPAVLRAGRRVMRVLETVLRPRWVFLLAHTWLGQVVGLAICVCGLLLLLPLPIPLANGLPALTVVLLAAALLERDGLCIVMGMGLFVVTLAFFGLLLFGGAGAVDWVTDWLRGRLEFQDE